MSGTRKKGFRFRPAHDIILLKEAIREMPWTAPHGQTAATWYQVSIGVTTSIGRCGGSDIVDHTTRKRRFDTLVATFKREELLSHRASGTEEEYSEREQLLTDVVSLLQEYAHEKTMVTAAEERKRTERDSATTEVLAAAMNTLKRPRSDSDIRNFKSPRKSVRPASARIVDILEQQMSAKIDSTDLQRKRLELDERHIALEEQRLTMDREKHLADVEEKRAQTRAYHAQTQLMLQLLSAMNANNKKAT